MPKKWKKNKVPKSIPGVYIPETPARGPSPVVAEEAAKCPYKDCIRQLANPGPVHGRVKGLLVVPSDYKTRCLYPEDAIYIAKLLNLGHAISLDHLLVPAIVFTY